MSHARNTLTTAATVVAALVLVGCSNASDSTTTPKPAAATSPSSSAPKPMEGIDGPLEAGRWIVPMWGSEPDTLPRAVVEVPAGYGSPGGWVVDRGADGDPDNYGTVSFWDVDTVFPDPCDPAKGDDPGPAVADLAQALRRQDRVRATDPDPVTFDGHAGLYLEIAFPKDDSRMIGCPESSYKLWGAGDGGAYGSGIAGTVSRVWILDVDGTRVVMVADTTPREDAAATAEVLGIARSAHFVEPLEPPAVGSTS